MISSRLWLAPLAGHEYFTPQGASNGHEHAVTIVMNASVISGLAKKLSARLWPGGSPLSVKRKGKGLRSASVAFAAMLHLGLLLMVMLAPTRQKFVDMTGSEGALMGELDGSSPGAVATPKQKPTLDKNREPTPDPPMKAAGKQPVLLEPKPSAREPDLAAMVREIMAASPDSAPIDFQIVDGALVVQANQPAVSASKSVAGAESTGSAGDVCQIAQALQSNLQTDETIKAALALVPAEQLSVANVLMLWDGDWVAEGAPGTSLRGPDTITLAVAHIKAAVEKAIEAAPRPCQTDVQEGPVFLLVQDADKPRIITIGSGTWRWADLLSASSDQAGEAGANGRSATPIGAF